MQEQLLTADDSRESDDDSREAEAAPAFNRRVAIESQHSLASRMTPSPNPSMDDEHEEEERRLRLTALQVSARQEPWNHPTVRSLYGVRYLSTYQCVQ